MIYIVDFEFWKSLAEILCGIMLVFSFIGKAELGMLYYPLLLVNIFLIIFSTIMMFFAKRRDITKG